MAFEIPGFRFTRPLADPGTLTEEDLNFRFAVVDANANAARAGSGVAADAVIQPPASIRAGAETPLMTNGVSKVVAGAAFAAGALLASDTEGRARDVAVDGTTGEPTEPINGKALEPAAGAGTVVAVLLTLGR